MVYVLTQNNLPLMPCTEVIARLLLTQGKAKCVSRTPFCIKLNYQTTNYLQEITLGVDTGSSKLGTAAVTKSGIVLYTAQVEIRNDITGKMTQRSKYRRNRRNRKTRYRAPRFLNRSNSTKTNRFSPTVISKINSHLKEIAFVQSILSITKVILETASFDLHALKDPKVLKNKWLYQKGINYGFANTKAFVLFRDDYTCQNCKGKTKNIKLETHHIIFRSNGGSDEQENLIALCKSCHDKVHTGELNLKRTGKIKSKLKYATQMNSIRIQLLKLLPNAEETFGFITKENRQALNLSKKHHFDAVSIATQSSNLKFKTNLLLKKCVPDGDYQQFKGIRSEQKIPTNKILGFRKFDKVLYLKNLYFIKGRMSSGYAILMDIEGTKIEFTNPKTVKLVKCKRISDRKSWLIQERGLRPLP